MPLTSTFISGPESPEQLPDAVMRRLELGSLQWLDVAQALDWLAQGGGARAVPGQEGPHLWWFYRAPWSHDPDGGLVDPAYWMDTQRRFLRARLRAGGRVRTWNLARDAGLLPPELVTSSGRHDPFVHDATQARQVPHGSLEMLQPGAGPSQAADTSALLGHLYAWVAPDCWDVFEALEGLAPPGTAAGPSSRDELQPPSANALAALVAGLNAASNLHAVQEELNALRITAARTAHALAGEQSSRAEAESRVQQARAEADALLSQLEQAREDLGRSQVQARAAMEETQAQHKAALQQGLADAVATFDKARAEHQQEATRLKDDAAARTAERDAARTSLADTQAALDKARVEHKTALEKALADAKATVDKARAEHLATLEKARREQSAALEKAQAEHQAALKATQGQLKEAQEEGELLLLQLHQVQEELEQLFLKGKETEAAHQQALAAAESTAKAAAERSAQALAAARADAKATLDKALAEHRVTLDKMQAQHKAALEKALADAKATVDKARAEHQQEATRLKDEVAARAAERDAARKSLAETQAALDKARVEHKAALEKSQVDAKATVDKARAEHQAALEKARREQSAALEKAQAEHQAALGTTQGQLKEAQEEGELLLLQLHQVQEELETHFLRGKDTEQQLQDLRRRYERMQRRHPQAVDIDALEVADADVSGAAPFLAWRLKGLAVQGHIWPELVLRTSLQPHGGGVGFKLEAPAGSPLAQCMDGPLVPKGLAARQPEQVQRFRAVGATAWRTLIAACAAVDEALASAELIERMPADVDPVFWKQALGPTSSLLRALPATFRHDGVRLKKEKVNSDYEHLWMVFQGAGHGEIDLGDFEMRLGAAQVHPEGFSKLPKLEFPMRADGKPPFEGWFEESRDDFGPKFELRADLNRQAFDIGVWSKLPKSAQALLLAFIVQLPNAVAQLAAVKSHRLVRAWTDWGRLAEGLIEVMRQRLSPPPAKPTTQRTEARSSTTASSVPQTASAPKAMPIADASSMKSPKTSESPAAKRTASTSASRKKPVRAAKGRT